MASRKKLRKTVVATCSAVLVASVAILQGWDGIDKNATMLERIKETWTMIPQWGAVTIVTLTAFALLFLVLEFFRWFRSKDSIELTLKLSNRGLLVVRVTNHGPEEERIEALFIEYEGANGERGELNKIAGVKNAPAVQHVLASRGNFETEFLLSHGTFVAYGLRKYRAKLALEDGIQFASKWHATPIHIEDTPELEDPPIISPDAQLHVQRLHADAMREIAEQRDRNSARSVSPIQEKGSWNRPRIEERIMVRLLQRSETMDEFRIHFDGIHDQLLRHHIESLVAGGHIQEVEPPKTGRSFKRWELGALGRKYLVDFELMPKANQPPASEKLTSFQRRIMNVLFLETCSTEEIAKRAIIPLADVEKQLEDLRAQTFLRKNAKSWRLLDRGEKRLFEDDLYA